MKEEQEKGKFRGKELITHEDGSQHLGLEFTGYYREYTEGNSDDGFIRHHIIYTNNGNFPVEVHPESVEQLGRPSLSVEEIALVMKEEITRVFGKRKTTYNIRLLETVFKLSSQVLYSKFSKQGWVGRPSLSVEDLFKLLASAKSNFCNPNHYTLKEQENITMKDALAIKSKIEGGE